MKPTTQGLEPQIKIILTSVVASLNHLVNETKKKIFILRVGQPSPYFLGMSHHTEVGSHVNEPLRFGGCLLLGWYLLVYIQSKPLPSNHASPHLSLSLQNCNVNFLLAFHINSGKISAHNNSVLCISSALCQLSTID